jgi:hypothetical protein
VSAAFAIILLGVVAALPAAAAVKVIDFTIHGGSWSHVNGVDSPYGLPQQPTISGKLTFDDTRTDADAFLDLDYVTGARVWTLADIQPGSGVFYSGDTFSAFVLLLGAGNVLGSNNAAGIFDGPQGISCNGCVSIDAISAVPEPGVWAMMVGGFALLGAALRRRKTALAG